MATADAKHCRKKATSTYVLWDVCKKITRKALKKLSATWVEFGDRCPVDLRQVDHSLPFRHYTLDVEYKGHYRLLIDNRVRVGCRTTKQ